MGRAATGNWVEIRGRLYARIAVAKGKRQAFALGCTKGEADKRTAELNELAARLRAAGQESIAPNILREYALATTAAELAEFRGLVGRIVSGKERAVPIGGPVAKVGETIRTLGEKWTSGELAKLHPDHVKAKRRPDDDAGRFRKHVYPVVGHVLVSDFTLDHAEAVMRALPEGLASASRRHVAQLLNRIMKLAVYPLRLREASPIPAEWMPSTSSRSGHWIYPDEDGLLMRAPADKVPLPFRLLYGFLAREGMRSASEAASLTWADVDLVRGAINLDENKTDDPRSWVLDPGVVRRWRSGGRSHRGRRRGSSSSTAPASRSASTARRPSASATT